MTTEEHKKRHKELHSALDELLADFITNSKDIPSLTTTSILVLIEWASRQVDNPDHNP